VFLIMTPFGVYGSNGWACVLYSVNIITTVTSSQSANNFRNAIFVWKY